MAWRIRSISTYFVVAAAGSASIIFLVLIALVIHQVENSLLRQKTELEKISDFRLASELDAQAHLAAARLRALFSDTNRRISAIASRSDTAAAIASLNVVAIAELLAPAAKNADVDSIVTIDRKGIIVGASSGETDLVAVGLILSNAPFFEKVRTLLQNNSRQSPQIYSKILMHTDFGSLIPENQSGSASHLVFVPLFDDFGDVSGGMIAQRWLRQQEPTLVKLSEIGSVSFSIFADNNMISNTGLNIDSAVMTNNLRRTNLTSDGRHIARCNTMVAPLRLCALKPIEALYATQSELTRIGREEQRRLFNVLVVFGLSSSALLIVLATFISRRITRPLLRITESLSDVAAGDYEEVVAGTERSDEVGDIARAVVVLQASARERDALRANIEVKNATLKRQEGELRGQNVLFDAALNNMSHGLCMFDANRHLIVTNQRYLELFSLTEAQAKAGMSWSDLFAAQDVDLTEFSPSQAKKLHDCAKWPGKRRSSETFRLRSGRSIHMTRQPLSDGGWVVIFDDVTEREMARDRLMHLANHDSLTSLPNRSRFHEHLESLVDRRNNESGVFGILCLDLDEFKTVNDSLGHPVGDDLLREISRRLLSITSDKELVARMGGDEFAIVTEIPYAQENLSNLARSVIEVVSQPFQLDEHEITIGVSIGIAMASGNDCDADDLLKQGDLALYQAKNDGRNTFRFFEPEMELNVLHRRNLTTDLRTAIGNGELEPYFQQQVNLQTGEISGFEALMRWHHPEKGLISPIEFIPIAEETGLIVPMGEWILRESCRIATSWPDHLRVAVNISVKQLQNKGFTTTLMHALATSGLPASRLELEVTESVLLSDDDETRKTLLRVKELGVKISMDDFGTGYSSLSCLRSFPFDKIKIDQSFVRTMADNGDSASIVRAIIDLAKSMNITTTAEGVETEDLVDSLRAIGCTEVQGYFFGRPEPADQTAMRILEAFPPAEIAQTG